jgi:hypothetical protein
VLSFREQTVTVFTKTFVSGVWRKSCSLFINCGFPTFIKYLMPTRDNKNCHAFLTVVWRSSPYSPTLSYPVVLFLSPLCALLSFLTWGLFVSQTARHSRPGSRREHFFLALGLEILFCFSWLWKPAKSRLVSRELHWERIFISFGEFSGTVLLSLLLLLLIVLPYPVVVH